MAYEVFEKTTVRVDQPAISVVPDGRIALNAAAVRVFKAAAVRYLLLLWDKDQRRIALKAVSARDKNAYAMSVLRDGQSSSIRCKSFLTHIGWNSQKRVFLDAIWNGEEKMLEVTLPKEHVKAKADDGPGRKWKTVF